jgi:polysaccharide biosynthesis protein PslH
VRERNARVHFLIVGAGRPLSEGPGPNVHFAGFVEDLAATLSNCDLAIAPMVGGSGMLTKVMDAMACGLPVLATDDGRRGFESPEAPVLCRALEDFPEAICELAERPGEVERLGQLGWSFARALPPLDVADLLTGSSAGTGRGTASR